MTENDKKKESPPSIKSSEKVFEKESRPSPPFSIKRVLSISIITLLIFIALSFYMFLIQIDKKITDHYIQSKATFAVRMLGIESLSHMSNNEHSYILQHVNNIATDQDILYAAVLDAENRPVAQSPSDYQPSTPWVNIQSLSGRDMVFTPLRNPKGKPIGYDVSMKILSGKELIGFSRVIISPREIQKILAPIRKEIFFLFVFITLAGALIALFIAAIITKPIFDLVKASEKVAGGDFDTLFPVASRTEIGLLAQSFNRMTKSIRKYQDKILNQSNELKAIINSMGSGLFTIDREWRITSFNKAAERITGYCEKEVLGKKCTEIFHSEACPRQCPLEKALQSDNCVLSNDFFIKDRDGHKIPITASASPLKNESGMIIGGVEVFKDLTELKELQKQLIQADKMSALGQMISGIAHDINNPTGVIHSNIVALSEYADVIKNLLAKYRRLIRKLFEKDVPSSSSIFSEVKTYEEECDIDYIIEDLDCLMEESKEAAKRITHIVKDLRNFIHVDVGQLQLADLNERLDVSLKLIKFDSMIKVTKEYSKIPQIYCNVQQIDQLFTNIFLNAVQAIGNHGEIRIRTSWMNERVRISIWDSGPGIPEEIQSKIFDPFFTTKEIGEGTGLGLSICFKIVSNHRGKIWVESEPHRGTEFFVELPFDPRDQIPPEPDHESIMPEDGNADIAP